MKTLARPYLGNVFVGCPTRLSLKMIFFAPTGQSRLWRKCFEQKIIFLFEMAQKDPDGPKRVPNDQKHWSFWSLSFPFGTLTSLPCLAIFGPKWAIFGQSPVMNGRTQSKKKADHHVSYVWAACGTPISPFWNINMAAIHEKCQKKVNIRWKNGRFLPLSCHWMPNYGS